MIVEYAEVNVVPRTLPWVLPALLVMKDLTFDFDMRLHEMGTHPVMGIQNNAYMEELWLMSGLVIQKWNWHPMPIEAGLVQVHSRHFCLDLVDWDGLFK